MTASAPHASPAAPRAAAPRTTPPPPAGFAGPASARPDVARLPPPWVIVLACALVVGGALAPAPKLGRICMAAIGVSLLINFVPARLVVALLPGLVVAVFVAWNPRPGAILLLTLGAYAASRVAAVWVWGRHGGPFALGGAFALLWGVFGALLLWAWVAVLDPSPGAWPGAGAVAGWAARAALAGGLGGFVAGLLVATVNPARGRRRG